MISTTSPASQTSVDPAKNSPRRIILVTGANGGLGRAISEAFLKESEANYVFLGIHHKKELASQIEAQHEARSRCISLDVSREEAWERAVSEILQAHSRLDVLVNNAGRIADGLLAMMSAQDWRDVLSTNLDGAFYGCRAALRPMVSQRSGRIINVASLSAILAPAGQTNYAAAKAGLVALTQSLAKEVARLNITINAVCPGYIETEALQSMPAADRLAAQSRIPMRRFGRPEEVASAIRFLACPEASYITGSVVKIDGGIY